ncbi:PREDICTED: oxidoreductase NAD-binding domain-containing protein 1 isoform X1 [Myotis brandtii]|uniref:oxidoreductase NAD-binding domain-containing protein 1 isoform X1 n=1 Tax=Myotis brandtii TaxID=109478 RepID=UPI0007042B26|nr:PREDICTED: oxidoreductase NAD-binding domain-containing protein 1 isoform X1 [Myotis brandtii]XP_014393043.1 PREDICTED: oxidoreductase NAD-binding domain-containing protein 1 isoform X1 [Myotis brandtii]XP_014393044.1 PREDICTED: oxidoreductase NAD-binding domain-containing protein 1 isoform X1 [Myotis brandtii]XP_014393046.1 PREDICTED: oxidoreductase NAD-binding domain-containing protein 1 isoform X1 [Myotis brandtii]
MACAAVLVPGLLRGSVGAICSQAALLKSTRGALRHLTLTSIMKSKRKTDHLERTANALRQEVVTAAKVCGTANESPSVKRLRLLVADQDFSFKAGQWIDFFIPGVSVVGGFSICSSPRLLEQERVIELAVKYTNHPPAVWIHKQCALDSEVAVRVGGEFFFDPQPADASRNLVLIAGGVGINPLLSILRHAADLHRERANQGSGYEIGTIRLFYSAKNTSELLFKKNILDLVNEFPEKIACSLHVTKQTTPISAELKPYITGDLCIITVACMQRIYIPASAELMPFAINEGRITEKEIREHISRETLFYICGPPPMTDFFSKQLENSHVPKEHICFEKWW